MQFKEVIGNGELKARLIKMADNGRTSHSMMFIEQDGCGALPMVLAFIQYLSCPNREEGVDSCGVCPTCRKISALQHPDLHFAFPVNATKKSGTSSKPVSDMFISEWMELAVRNPYFTEKDLYAKMGIEDKSGIINVMEAKLILDRLSLKSYEGFNKYMVIWLPERMNAEAANRLLKVVEEPMPDTYFMFVTHAPEKVLGTIRSRTLPVRLYPASAEEVADVLQASAGMSRDEALGFGRSSGGSIGMALDMAGEVSDTVLYAPLLVSMLESAVKRDLVALLSGNDELVALGREKQKAFCIYAEEFLRKMMMVSLGLPSLANMHPAEKEPVERMSGRLSLPFCEKAAAAFGEARLYIESNVNAKMVFSHLSNIIYVTVNPFIKQ